MQSQLPKPVKSGHVPVNGVNYHYAIYGKGEPLLLLHGGLYHTEMFGPVLTQLAQSREVIGVDLHGHGRTDLGNREINLVDSGDDMAAIVSKLGYRKVDVLGHSMGGGVAFRFAAQHPQLVRRAVLLSAPYAQADIQVLHDRRAASGGFSEAARSHGRIHEQAVRLVGRRQEADDAGTAGVWRQ
jgi:pimeloyl-ACP methyl ester carboxylesterase